MKYSLPCLVLLIAFETVAASPVVIHDSGNTVSILPYYSVLQADTRRKPQARQQSAALRLSALFPVRTPAMTPGRVLPRGIEHIPYTGQPIFMVGTDRGSLQWLREHRQTLNKLSAVGLAVQVESPTAYRQLVELAEGLPILPMSGQSLAKALQLQHYPVLISHRGIEQ